METKIKVSDNVTEMTLEDARVWARDDCPYCQANLKLAELTGLKCLVNTESRDVIGVVAKITQEKK